MAAFYTPADPNLRGTQAHHLLQSCIDGVAQTAIQSGVSEIAVRWHFIQTRGTFDHVLGILNRTLQLDEAAFLPAEESQSMAGLPFPATNNRFLPANTIPHTTQPTAVSGRNMAGLPFTAAAPAQTWNHPVQLESSARPTAMPSDDFVANFLDAGRDAEHGTQLQNTQTNTRRNNSEHQGNITSPVPENIEEPTANTVRKRTKSESDLS